MQPTFQDLTGQKFGEMTVVGYNRDVRRWICVCDKGHYCYKQTTHLKTRHNICKQCKAQKDASLVGSKIGELTVLKQVSSQEYLCQCSCGKTCIKQKGHLVGGYVKSCGHLNKNKFENLRGQRFGKLVAEEYVSKEAGWKCKCDCGNIVNALPANLKNGSTASCGCSNPYKLIDITNKRFGKLVAVRHIYRGLWECQCDCGNICEKQSYDLRNNRVISCGCESSESYKEFQLYEYIRSIYNGEIIKHNKTILKGKEIDIYIPEKHIAIEFNGNYWHSLKEKRYHQDKTIDCVKQKIRLIHIFEYEWDNDIIQEKLKIYLKTILNESEAKVIYARNTNVHEINQDIAQEFLNKYHLQGYASSTINIGCYYNEQLIGMMTFGKPRFNNSYEYEIVRLCWLPTIHVVGGLEKLFSYFLTKYNPQSIITYVDISKFTGNSYLRIGFKLILPDPITKPNYVWVSHHGNTVKKRYQTQKADLVKNGLGTEDQTEDEIMESLGYYKIYDCGNIKLEWVKEDNNKWEITTIYKREITVV